MQDYSFSVPIFGGSRTIVMNALDVVHSDHCHVCRCRLGGAAVVALGTPICALVHQQCLPMVNYSDGWQHPFPVSTYRDAALVHIARGRSPPINQENNLRHIIKRSE